MGRHTRGQILNLSPKVKTRYILTISGPRNGTSCLRQWENETPPGGLTELYVFKQDSKTVWPDEKLGPTFSSIDPRCSLPGNTGPAEFLTSQTTSTTKETPGQSQFIQVSVIIFDYSNFINIRSENHFLDH